jgi:hypothetical protein
MKTNPGYAEEECYRGELVSVVFNCSSRTKEVYRCKPKYWICVHFRALNAVTKYHAYALPVFNEAVSILKGSQYYTTLDLASEYWQIQIAEPDREKTAFYTPSGSFQYRRLDFGLSNSSAIFQRLMDLVMTNLIGIVLGIYRHYTIFGNHRASAPPGPRAGHTTQCQLTPPNTPLDLCAPTGTISGV